LERNVFVDYEGVVQPAPAPRMSRTPAALTRKPPAVGEHTVEVLREFGADADRLKALLDNGAIGGPWGQPPKFLE
jgi:alpha-methylacyl-CoA racemase